jgi:hypothetical protein
MTTCGNLIIENTVTRSKYEWVRRLPRQRDLFECGGEGAVYIEAKEWRGERLSGKKRRR